MGGEQGTALFVALMAMMMLSALGLGLVLTTTTEVLIVGNYRDAQQGLYAADAAIERILPDLLAVPDWGPILAGSTTSAFVDGPSSGTRLLRDGSTLDLTEATNMVNCGKTATCSIAELEASTEERPWGANNPRWKLFAHSPVDALLPTGMVTSSSYVAVWVADDPAENDGDPTKDGSTQGNPGLGVIVLRAVAYGPGGMRKVIEATVARGGTTQVERGYTGQIGQGEQNRRGGRSRVPTVGQAVAHMEMDLAAGGFVPGGE